MLEEGLTIKEKARSLYLSGLSLKTVASMVGRSYTATWKYCKDIIRSDEEKRKLRFPEKQVIPQYGLEENEESRDLIRSLYNQGLSTLKIMELYNFRYCYVYRCVKDIARTSTRKMVGMQNSYQINGDITRIIIKNKSCIIDTEDLEKVKKYTGTWNIHGIYKNLEYVYMTKMGENGCKKRIMLHRIIMDAPKGMHVDHINHDTLDNRKSNLRIVTNAENIQNRGTISSNKSGISGVRWSIPLNKWVARFVVNKKLINVGSFYSFDEAKTEIIKAKVKHSPFSPEARMYGGYEKSETETKLP